MAHFQVSGWHQQCNIQRQLPLACFLSQCCHHTAARQRTTTGSIRLISNKITCGVEGILSASSTVYGSFDEQLGWDGGCLLI